VTRSRFRLDPSSLTAAIALAVLAALVNGVWILLDHSDPSWDQAHYLSTALQYRDAFHIGGPIELLHAIDRADPSHGPFFTIVLLPALRIFGASNSSGLIVNLVAAPVLYLAAGEIAYTLFRSGFARLLTIFLVATTPILVGLFHNVLQDFLLVTLTTLSLLLLLKSEGFRRRWITWAMALTMGLGTLTKVTFPLFVIGPLAVVLAEVVFNVLSARRRGQRDGLADPRPVLLNLGGAALVYLVVALVWYGPNFSETLDYVRSTTGGPLSLGAGPSNPYTFHAVTSFTLGMINFNLSWVILLLGLIGAILSWRRLRSLFERPIDPAPLWKLAFLLAWALIPYLSVALAHNQDVRLMAPAFPAVAVLAAGAVSAIPRVQWRMALAAVAVVVLAYQTLNHITDVTPGFMPDRASVSASSYEAAITLNSEPIGYEQLPGSDYVTPIFEYIEKVASREPGDPRAGKTICLLQSEPVINSNTLGFMSAARGDAYGFADIVQGPGGPAELKAVLSGCSFALYVRPAKVPLSGPHSRLALVNEPYAAHHMTPQMFRLFQGPSRSFPVVSNPPTKGEPEYLSTAGGGRVRVLTRIPEAGPGAG
jgi:4-amino-4-deoxy-L-arabinose transferase-like glycosyltransferase